MAGWDLKSGVITEYVVTEDRIWSLFNYVFSDSCRKRNTYKFGLIKALLDNVFNGTPSENGVFFSYNEIFGKFAENYWNLVIKYDLRQMRPDGKSKISKIEKILKDAVSRNSVIASLEFDALDKVTRDTISKTVAKECKNCVVGALYEDFEGVLYEFNLKKDGLILNFCMHEFMQKYKMEIEKLNYYSWAKFLEQVNDESALIRVIDKLESATPRRNDLSVYREILFKEFEENTCFYCGKKLQKNVHVDHFIPWTFVKDDRIWNFVLSCPLCNIKKNDRIAPRDYIIRVENRNKRLIQAQNEIIQMDFEGYSDGLIERMWNYAKLSGLKEYHNK